VPQIVQNYSTEFAQMAEDRFGNKKQPSTPNPRVVLGSTTIENYFSPEDGIRQHIIEKLNAATKSIRFQAFSFTSDEIKDAMIAKRNAGLTVQGVFETRNAGGIGSEYEPLKSGGVDVLEDGNCYTMHSKTIIIDDHIVITGSYNFTARAEDVNDENIVIIDDAAIAQQYIAEFERVYTQAREPTRCGS
jgi:phosphatidylserine/phosphatidylglycerophosphate/cardiolipin synthase-like enzyme